MTINRNYCFNSENFHFEILLQAVEELLQKRTHCNKKTNANNNLGCIQYVPGVICNMFNIILPILYEEEIDIQGN